MPVFFKELQRTGRSTGPWPWRAAQVRERAGLLDAGPVHAPEERAHLVRARLWR